MVWQRHITGHMSVYGSVFCFETATLPSVVDVNRALHEWPRHVCTTMWCGNVYLRVIWMCVVLFYALKQPHYRVFLTLIEHYMSDRDMHIQQCDGLTSSYFRSYECVWFCFMLCSNITIHEFPWVSVQKVIVTWWHNHFSVILWQHACIFNANEKPGLVIRFLNKRRVIQRFKSIKQVSLECSLQQHIESTTKTMLKVGTSNW